VAVSSGTAALDVALKLFEVKPGDEIIVPAFAYIASANCILYQGAIPVFVDVDPVTFNIDPVDVRNKITAKTRCIIALDYGGQSAPWDQLRTISKEYGIFLIEDSAPAFGGKYRGESLCTMGDISITSFHTAKIFHTVEGGMIFTKNENMSEKARIIISQGESRNEKYFHPMLGHNYRMSDLHAAIGLAQLSRFDKVVNCRKSIADIYSRELSNISGVQVPEVLSGNIHAWFLYAILLEKRDEIRNLMLDNGIGTNISWPYPVYEQPHFKKFKRQTCPVAESLCNRILCLPIYYNMTSDEQSRVVSVIRKVVHDLGN